MKRISVLLADGHGAYRQGLARAIEAHPRLKLVAEAADGREALEQLLAHEPEVAVLEMRMPLLDGLEIGEILRGFDHPPHTCLVLISSEVNETLAAAARAAGVAAVLSKEATRSELCDRLAEIADAPPPGS